MGHQPATWRLPAVPGSVPKLRRELLEAISGRGFDDDGIGLAVTEAVTNAVLHAYPGSDGSVAVSLEDAGDRLVVVVSDEGMGALSFTARSGSGPGMGLSLLYELCASVRVDPGNAGTTVTMGFAKIDR